MTAPLSGATPRIFTPAATTATKAEDTASTPGQKPHEKQNDGVLDGAIIGSLFLGGNPVALMPGASAGAKLAGLVVGMGIGALVGGAVDAMIQDNDPGELGPFDNYLRF